MGSAESAVDVRSGGGSSRTASIYNVDITRSEIPMGSTESAVNVRSGGGRRRTTRIDNVGITFPETPMGSSIEARTDIIDQLKVDNDSETAGITLDAIGETDVVMSLFIAITTRTPSVILFLIVSELSILALAREQVLTVVLRASIAVMIAAAALILVVISNTMKLRMYQLA
jgi:hypothetical protein